MDGHRSADIFATVELPSAGAYHLAAPVAIRFLYSSLLCYNVSEVVAFAAFLIYCSVFYCVIVNCICACGLKW